MSVEPAGLSFDAGGAPMSARYGDVYASRDGALGQARHVFLGGTRAVERWAGRDQFVILETGFGLGVNFLAAWQAWRDDPARPARLHYVSIERHPLPAAALFETAPAELQAEARTLAARWPVATPGLHRLEFEAGRVVLTLALGDAREIAPALRLGADAIFLDGFAPDRNPEMWEPALLRAVARLARQDCTLATWSTARPVGHALSAAGFDVAHAPGYGHKRRMLVARYAPRYTVRRHAPPAPYGGERRAVVVGAGLAGAACAEALARRGWAATVIDSAAPAGGASALPWGSMHPHFAADDNLLARLTRAGCATTLAALARVAPDGRHVGTDVWRRAGLYEVFEGPLNAERARSALARLGFPEAHVAWTDAAAARVRVGLAPAQAGWWWPQGCAVAPPAFVRALLARDRIACLRAAVGGLRSTAAGWDVLATDGTVLAEAPIVVVAAALATPRLLASGALPAQPVAGRVTLFESAALADLRCAVSGDGTLLRAPDGRCAVGATYETGLGATDAPLDERAANYSNLARLQRLLAPAVDARVTGSYAGERCVARDRLPYAGAVADETLAAEHRATLRGAHFADLPRRRGLYTAFALGSRGLTFAPLAAEAIAARIEGEPGPLEVDLLNALDPGRVLLRRLRRGAHRPAG